MTKETIDNTLHRIHLACIRHRSPMAEPYVFDSIAWYVATGRASLGWIKALATKRYYKGMITKALAGDLSTMGVVSTITSILEVTP